MADAESSQSPGLVLVAITCLGSISWPLLVARWALDFAYHGKHLGPPTVMEVGPLVAVSSALIALAMWRRNRLTVESLVKAGAFGGFCIGALLMCLGELRRVGGQLDPGPRAWLAIRAFVGGALWAAPISIVVGGLFGLTTWWVLKGVGVVGPAWPVGRSAQRMGVVVVVVLELLIAILVFTSG